MIAALLLLAEAVPPDPSWDCAQPQVQQEMNWCAGQDFARADAALNAQWKQSAAEAKRLDDARLDRAYDNQPGYFDTLLKAQRAWLGYRDAHCLSEAFAARGGTMQPLLEAACRAELTKQRTQQLRDLYAPMEGSAR